MSLVTPYMPTLFLAGLLANPTAEPPVPTDVYKFVYLDTRPTPEREISTNVLRTQEKLVTSKNTTENDALSVIDANAQQIDIERQTTPYERLLGEIRSWTQLEKNWDYDDADKPHAVSIKNAEAFVEKLSDTKILPMAVLRLYGTVSLCWENRDSYIEIEFLGDNRVAYFKKTAGGKTKGIYVNPKAEEFQRITMELKDDMDASQLAA